jgi:iron(III) transport system substrate-binding protein
MLPPRRTLVLPLLLLASVLSLTACGASSGLTLYSGQHEQTTSLLAAAFERESHIKVAIRFGDEASLAQQILQEGGGSPADVYYSENSPALEALREHGALAAVDPHTLAAVPHADSAADGSWVGVSARISALVYNTTLIAPSALPSSVLELADPRYAGKVGFAPSETDFQPLVTAIILRDGEAAAERWLKGLQANAKVYPDNETALTQVNNGESLMAPVNHYYWYRLRTELGAAGTHTALHYYAPGDVGALINVSGAAALKSSSHPREAQAFLAFLVSAAGQQVIAHSSSYEYPLRAGVAPAPDLTPLAFLHPVAITPSQLGDGSRALALEQKLGLL